MSFPLNQSLTRSRPDTLQRGMPTKPASLVRLFDAGKTMPKWSGYHVKTDGRAYFRLRVPKGLHHQFGGQWPTVNLGLKAGRDAERLALMHYIAAQGVFADRRRELAEEAMRPRPRPLSERTEEDMRGLAKHIAQSFNRAQYAALRSRLPDMRSTVTPSSSIQASSVNPAVSSCTASTSFLE